MEKKGWKDFLANQVDLTQHNHIAVIHLVHSARVRKHEEIEGAARNVREIK